MAFHFYHACGQAANGAGSILICRRAEAKNYLDIDALLRQGTDLLAMLAPGAVVYGRKFNPLITLKALSYFDDVPTLPGEVRARLARAVVAVDVTQLPALTPYAKRPENGMTP